MKDPRLDEAAAKLRVALEMYALGESIMRQNLRRRFPDESAEEIEARILDWLADRPGAEHGDASGFVRDPQTV
jgi:hypothetical protein